MGDNEEDDLFCNLSRKELQYFCKKYGLPANRSHSELGKSLASFLQKNDVSVPLAGKLGGIQDASLLQRKTPSNPFGVSRNNGCEIFSSGEEGSKELHSQTIKCDGLGCFNGSNSYIKETPGSTFVSPCNAGTFTQRDRVVEIMPEILNRFRNEGAVIKGCAIAPVTPSGEVSPSFEFYVRSEEGINLCVDLTSSPSDWAEKMKTEIYICENMHDKKCQSIHEELGHFGASDGDVKSASQQSTDVDQSRNALVVEEENDTGFDRSDENHETSMSPQVIPHSLAVNASENLEENQAQESAEFKKDVKQSVSATGYCPKDEGGCSVSLDSIVTDTSVKSKNNSPIISNGPKSLLTREHQFCMVHNEISEKSTQRISSTLFDPSSAFLGCSNSTMEIALSEVVSHGTSCLPCKDGVAPIFMDPANQLETGNDGLVNFIEQCHGTCGNYLPTSADEQQHSNITDGKESSECSNMNNLLESTSVSSDDLKSTEEPLKKRPYADCEDQNVCGKRDAKLLKSTKQHGGEVIPRRSMRLSP